MVRTVRSAVDRWARRDTARRGQATAVSSFMRNEPNLRRLEIYPKCFLRIRLRSISLTTRRVGRTQSGWPERPHSQISDFECCGRGGLGEVLKASAPNKANFPRFWAKNAGRRKSKANLSGPARPGKCEIRISNFGLLIPSVGAHNGISVTRRSSGGDSCVPGRLTLGWARKWPICCRKWHGKN